MSSWFAVVDAAQHPSLLDLIKRATRQECLFSGDVPADLAAASPYLVEITDGIPLMDAWRDHGAGQNWGLMIESELSFDTLRRHLKKFLNAKLPDGTVALFRFYDPRVFNTYIRACSRDEFKPWFAGILQYSVEGADGVVHNYRLRQERLFDGEAAVG